MQAFKLFRYLYPTVPSFPKLLCIAVLFRPLNKKVLQYPILSQLSRAFSATDASFLLAFLLEDCARWRLLALPGTPYIEGGVNTWLGSTSP